MSAVGAGMAEAVGPHGRRGRPVAFAGLALAAIVAAILAVLVFQAAGYAPCELCLKERLPFYAGSALAAIALVLAARGPRAAATVAFAALVVLFLGSAAFGAYHAGVEWGFWPGPSDCTGAPALAATNADFLHQLETVRVVRCDAVAIRILGLSLAGWNAVGSLVIAGLAASGLRALQRGPAVAPGARGSSG